MYYAAKRSFGLPLLQTWWNSVAAVNVAGLLAVNAFVSIETPTQILDPFPIVSSAGLGGTHITPTIAMAAHGAEVGEQVPIFGRVFLPVQGIGIQQQIPSAKALAPWTFLGATVCGFLVNPIHERIRMRVVHVGRLFVCHVSSVARMEDPVKDYFSLFGRLR